MKPEESVPDQPSDRVIAAAHRVAAVFESPPYVDVYGAGVRARGERPTVPGMLAAAFKDSLQFSILSPDARKAAYRLNRELGLSRAHALFHTSPATGFAVATVVAKNVAERGD